MPSAFNAIADAVVARLAIVPAVCPSIGRATGRPLPEEATSAVLVHLREALPEPSTVATASIEWRTKLDIECYAAGAAAAVSGSSAADALLLAAHNRLLADPTLAGACDFLEIERIGWEVDSQAGNAGCATLSLVARHQTRNQTLA